MGAHLLVLPEVTNRMRGIYQHIRSFRDVVRA
jgi:hypothetical protein